MRRILGLLTLGILISVASGCGTLTNHVSPKYLSATDITLADKGIVIFSTGAPERCTTKATFIRVFDLQTKELVKGVSSISVDASAVKSEFEDHHGAVSALSLPAGQYYISPIIAHPHIVGVKIPKFSFEVTAGQTTYLGELFMTRSCDLNTSFIVKDEFSRDMQMVLKENGAFSRVVPVKRLLQSITDG